MVATILRFVPVETLIPLVIRKVYQQTSPEAKGLILSLRQYIRVHGTSKMKRSIALMSGE